MAERSAIGVLSRGAFAGLALAAIAFSASGAGRLSTANFEAGERQDESVIKQVALNTYRQLPLAFVQNAGQLDHRVRYAAQAGNASVFLTRRGVVVALAEGGRGLALRLAFLGANTRPMVVGARRSPGRVNYLVGNDPSRWWTNLPTYAEVVYMDLWPGIDLAVRGEGGQLKYEFRLAPGADPVRIRLGYSGQERLSLERSGGLRIETAHGLLRDSRPLSYQPIGDRRVAVASRFVL